MRNYQTVLFASSTSTGHCCKKIIFQCPVVKRTQEVSAYARLESEINCGRVTNSCAQNICDWEKLCQKKATSCYTYILSLFEILPINKKKQHVDSGRLIESDQAML